MSFRHIPLCCRISHLDLQAALGSPCIFFRLVRSVREPLFLLLEKGESR